MDPRSCSKVSWPFPGLNALPRGTGESLMHVRLVFYILLSEIYWNEHEAVLNPNRIVEGGGGGGRV